MLRLRITRRVRRCGPEGGTTPDRPLKEKAETNVATEEADPKEIRNQVLAKKTEKEAETKEKEPTEEGN